MQCIGMDITQYMIVWNEEKSIYSRESETRILPEKGTENFSSTTTTSSCFARSVLGLSCSLLMLGSMDVGLEGPLKFLVE